MPASNRENPLVRFRLLAASAGLLSLLFTTGAQGSGGVVAPFAGSPDYIAEGVLVGAKGGSHRGAFTTRFTGEPAIASRPLSVHPDSNFNGELARTYGPRLGSRALPPVFGGFTMIVYGMKEPAPFTNRVQFHDSPTKRNDFINLNVYVENKQPQPAGLEFSFIGALLFPAGNEGAPKVVPIEKVSHAAFFVASQRAFARVSRVLVRDADGGDFYISEVFATDKTASLPLTGGKWAKINPADLTVAGEYLPAPFQRFDHIGIYATIPVTEIADPLPSFGIICNVALHSFEYVLLP